VEKHQVNIYRFNSNSLNAEEIPTHLESKGYSPQQLNLDEKDGFAIKLFYKRNASTPKWKGFIKPGSLDKQR